MTMLVVSDPGVVWNEKGTADRTTAYADWITVLGRIDSSGGFSRTIAPGLTAPTTIARGYELVLTDTHWVLEKDGTLKEVKGPPEWKIKSFQAEPRVSAATAIRYLKELRNQTRDDAKKKRISKTIAILTSHDR